MGAGGYDPDERDWRLSGEVEGSGVLHTLDAIARGRRGPETDADGVAGPDVVVTHDGNRVFAYAASREAIERARTKLEGALASRGLSATLALACWSDEHDEWIDPDAPPPPPSSRAQDARASETRTYGVRLGRWVREEFEQSLRARAEQLGIACEVVEHPHLLSTQAAFTVTGPPRKLDEFAAAMNAEEQATIRTERAVMASPL
jgi:hypothetical protein